MDMEILNTAGSALSAERLRMDVISSNIANSNTTHDVDGNYSPYKRKSVEFQTILNQKTGLTGGVSVNQIIEDQEDLRKAYEPNNPNADESGYVEYPNVSMEREMVDLVTSKTAYEANIKAIQVFKAMFNSALDI
jgi:flagellar basal-body rod protein FlgC